MSKIFVIMQNPFARILNNNINSSCGHSDILYGIAIEPKNGPNFNPLRFIERDDKAIQ
jgi:hypothetical protein